MASGAPCPTCGKPMMWVAQYQRWYCQAEKQYKQVQAPPPPPPPPPPPQPRPLTATPTGRIAAPAGAIWSANFYRIRKKSLALTNQYWIEDQNNHVLGYSKQKMLALKELIRIYTDESLQHELFRIQQTQILDLWGTFAVIDTMTNTILGYIKRKALMSMIRDEWHVLDPYNRLVAEIKEETGRALMRRFIPMGALIPEKVILSLGGRPVAEINQQFKIIGDIWEMSCTGIPPQWKSVV